MNTIEIARENFINVSRHCYFSPACPTFAKPNAKRGYGAVLKLLSNGSMPSRAAILKKLGLPTSVGYYASVFQALLWSKLISYDRANGYTLTPLGKDYVAENLVGDIPSSKASSNCYEEDDDNDEAEHVTVPPTWKKTFDVAMNAYKAAMDAYKIAMGAFA